MGRAWDTSYLPKPLMTLCQVKVIRGDEVKMVKLKMSGLTGVIMFLGQFFAKSAKICGKKFSDLNRSKNI